jgi:hypothetical protein
MSSPIWDSWLDIHYCLTVTVLFLWGALSDERTGVPFVYAAGPCQRSLSRNHILLSHRIWDFPFRRLLRLAGSRWRYSTPPPHGFQSIPIPVFSYILSARTTYRKHSPSIVAWHRPHRIHVSRVRLLVYWPVASTVSGADYIENSLIYCYALDRVQRAVAWQRVGQIH